MINKCNLILFLLVISFFYTVPQSVWAGESDTYNFSWLDPDKEVYVLQNRRYRKANRLHVYAGVGKTLSGAFVDSSNIQGRAGHYFMEEYGFEVIYSKNSGKENTTAANVRDNGSGTGSRPFRRIVDTYYGGMFLWSPFYSKINTFNTIIYYDWIFGAGIGKIKESNNADEFQVSAGSFPDTIEEHNAILWNIGIKIFLGASISARIDVTAVHYQATSPVVGSPEKLWNDNFDLGLMLGYNF
ncbi:MAG: outer membrane beta-barrel domain-containing protein [Bacteriovoracaceae bacterium]|nr:outer membrane beta-barrel domain-containing protein [Bacteriovoracaceae bacterium]